jgi:hypothetical protein
MGNKKITYGPFIFFVEHGWNFYFLDPRLRGDDAWGDQQQFL